LKKSKNQFRTKKEAKPKRKGRKPEVKPTTPQTYAEVKEVKLMLRIIFAGLNDSFNFEKPLIERSLPR